MSDYFEDPYLGGDGQTSYRVDGHPTSEPRQHTEVEIDLCNCTDPNDGSRCPEHEARPPRREMALRPRHLRPERYRDDFPDPEEVLRYIRTESEYDSEWTHERLAVALERIYWAANAVLDPDEGASLPTTPPSEQHEEGTTP